MHGSLSLIVEAYYGIALSFIAEAYYGIALSLIIKIYNEVYKKVYK